MPNLLQPPWLQIIPLIPTAEHSVSVKAATWEGPMDDHGLLNHHGAVFGGNSTVRLSRSRLRKHAYPNQVQKCLEILMWGWPASSQGNLRLAFLQNVNAIASEAPLASPWPAYYQRVHIPGIGVSTITKLAYFYGHRFANKPSLILDSRVIAVLANGRWQGAQMPGIRYDNAVNRYLDYLTLLSTTASQLRCKPDQIELFLFSWGGAF